MFRNYGPTSGASLAHPHTQLVALAMTPPYVRSRDAWARAWQQDHGRCVICDELDLEQKGARRIVAETELFIALVPFAATCPFELWLVPKRHQASFAEIRQRELSDIGPLLRKMLRRLKSLFGDPAYNFVVESAGKSGIGRPDLHWRLRIAPSLTTPGGFELAAGVPINPSNPEDDAKALRSADDNVPRV
jgi:UDPglucose--hexose-1-phosphate uridylyltransferase